MKILIDGRDMGWADDSGSFGDLFDRITKHCAGERRVVVQVAVDHSVLADLERESLAQVDVKSVGLVEATTACIGEVAADVLKKCADAIPRLIEGLYASADRIQVGDAQKGYEAIGSLLSFWSEIAGGVGSGLVGSGRDLSAVRVEVGESGNTETLSGQVILERINGLLEDTQRAFENGDSVEIADIVGYDLPVLIRGFQQSLYKLLET